MAMIFISEGVWINSNTVEGVAIGVHPEYHHKTRQIERYWDLVEGLEADGLDTSGIRKPPALPEIEEYTMPVIYMVSGAEHWMKGRSFSEVLQMVSR